ALPISQQFGGLQVNPTSWLGATPIDLTPELTAKLRDANIEITDDSAAPLVTFTYEENGVPGCRPFLVPATEIEFDIAVRNEPGGSFIGKHVTTAISQWCAAFP